MSAYTAVLLYVIWMLVLMLLYAAPRIPQALMGTKPIDSWERGREPVDPACLQRIKAAHMNCVENFPLFAAVVAIAALTGQLAAVGVAAYVFYARVIQSVIHMTGTSFIQILLRATFFLIQVGLILYMAIRLIH